MTSFSNLLFQFMDDHQDWCLFTINPCDWVLFLGVHKLFYKNEDDLWIFSICQNNLCWSCMPLLGWGWAAARFVWRELFLLTIVFLQISVPALTRPALSSAALKSCGGRKQSFREFLDDRRDTKASSWSQGLTTIAILCFNSNTKIITLYFMQTSKRCDVK